ncbi:hypothetical protein [Candidatus Marithrix sp. Canyon 246]|uniref:hypothetical protein n=1 Tax=Candidatus Marithrix sp. Canyon 246 TaxID=1827136 RepID=UPI000849FA2E|nr:hypothetical protein [Candidatus Marithrix sp. Canyon 246]
MKILLCLGLMIVNDVLASPCLIIPDEAIKIRQKALSFRLTYLKNKAHHDDLSFIERARIAVKSNTDDYSLVLTIKVEKEKRLYGPLLQLSADAQGWLNAGNMLQFYRECGTYYIESSIMESSMRLLISYHPETIEQAEKLRKLLSTNLFDTLEQTNIGKIPIKLYMETWGNGKVQAPNNKKIIKAWISQALLRIYQPKGGKIKQVHQVLWKSHFPAVAIYCTDNKSKCELNKFYREHEQRENKKLRLCNRSRLLELIKIHNNASLRECLHSLSYNCLKLLQSLKQIKNADETCLSTEIFKTDKKLSEETDCMQDYDMFTIVTKACHSQHVYQSKTK